MNLILITATLLFLLVLFFDIKNKTVPSILGTSIIFVLGVVNFQNLFFGIIMFVFGWFLYESGIYKGIADVKMITAIGFLISTMQGMYQMVVALTLVTLIYNVVMVMIFKNEEYAGTVPIFISYLVVVLIGGIA